MALFSPEDLAALQVAGAAERWAAVQARLHPRLAVLVTQIEAALRQHFPRIWTLYEVSYKSQRYLNRGRGERLPIEEYHVAFDRPPRGSGVLVAVSAVERAVMVGLQLWGARKPQLRQAWDDGRLVWLPLMQEIAARGEARFVRGERRSGAEPNPPLWIDRYLTARGSNYLWVGFVYPWATLPADLEARIIADVLHLLPLNEALMEIAEAREPSYALLVREGRAPFATIPPIETIIERMHARGFTLSETIIRSYHIAIQTRPLIILPGISGTGKTRLTRLYADALYALGPNDADNPYYLVVAVQPDWHNARDLLGYYNALTATYHPTAFLRFVLRAAADPQQLYFVCLDELNLARPEYYLAPILSAMETVEHSIDLGTPAEVVTSTTGEPIRNPLRLPLNLRLIGTVNVDESTHSLSDKLLDRANVIELTAVDLAAFRAAYPNPIDDTVWQTITTLHASIARAGHPFGYRVLAEILRYLEHAQGTLAPTQALDLQIKQKILPKLRGEENPRLRRVLQELLALLLDRPLSTAPQAAQIPPEMIAAAPYPESAEKVRRMIERLDQEGFTDFYS